VQITSLNDIIQGELLNSPAISFIYNVKTDVSKIQEGDLFFASNHEEIAQAIDNGAFAIVIEESISIQDKEIAWIKVDNIQKAIIKYLRYKLSQWELEAYSCDTITFELFKLFASSATLTKKIWLFSTNLTSLLNNIHEVKEHDVIFCHDAQLLHSLYPKNSKFLISDFKVDNLIEHSLFETSFSYQQHYFLRLRLSSLFIRQFLTVFEFLNANLDLNKLKRLNYFKPIFIDKFFNACEYGKSDKFVLIQEKSELALEELRYIQEKYKYAKTLIFSKEAISLDGFSYTLLSTVEDIFQLLQNSSFNAIYIIGFKKQKIEALFKNNYTTNSLL
jgi:hypothetical protein